MGVRMPNARSMPTASSPARTRFGDCVVAGWSPEGLLPMRHAGLANSERSVTFVQDERGGRGWSGNHPSSGAQNDIMRVTTDMDGGIIGVRRGET